MKTIQVFSNHNPLTLEELNNYLGEPYDTMVKFVIDIEQQKIAIGGEMHSDSEEVLLKNGSLQENLWGANIYPLKDTNEWLEYNSLINIRPSANNFGLEIESVEIQKQIKEILFSILK